MKFVIEVARVTDGGAYEVLYRSSIVAMSQKLAKFAVESLIGSAKARGANCVKIRNSRGEELYSWRF
jgi:hypothetical protein